MHIINDAKKIFRSQFATCCRRRFTLLEILVAVMMICILAGLLTGTFQHARAKARRSAQSAQNVKILTAVEKFKDDFEFYPLEVEYKPANGLVYQRIVERQLPDPSHSQKDNATEGSTLAKAIAFSTVVEGALDPLDENFCDPVTGGAEKYDPACDADIKKPITWVGNYLAKGEVKVNSDGEIIDLWGKPLIYWTRYGEKNETVAKGADDNYPPEYKASNKPRVPEWLIELWAAPNPPGPNWLNGYSEIYPEYTPPAGSNQLITVEGTTGTGDCYYFFPMDDPSIGSLNGAVIFGQNNNWYFAYPPGHPQNISGTNYKYGGPFGYASGNNLSFLYSGPANGFNNIASIFGSNGASDERVINFLHSLATTLFEVVETFNYFPSGGGGQWKIAAESTDHNTALALYYQITPSSTTTSRVVMKEVIRLLRGTGGAAAKDWDLAPEIWSGGADKIFFHSDKPIDKCKWTGTAIEKTCLRLGAYRQDYMGRISDANCLYNHSADNDNVGGDLSQQKK